jgi:hypothetical protein
MLTVWALLYCKISLLQEYFFSFFFFFFFFDMEADMFQKYGGATAETVQPFIVELYRMIDQQYPS